MTSIYRAQKVGKTNETSWVQLSMHKKEWGREKGFKKERLRLGFKME